MYNTLFWAIIGGVLFFLITGLWSVFRSKNKKLDIKEQINMVANPIIMCLPIHFIVITIFIVLGCEYVKESSWNILLLNLSTSMEYGIIFIMAGGLALILIDITETKGRKSQYIKWIKSFEIDGLIKYTEEEKAIRKIEHEKEIAKFR